MEGKKCPYCGRRISYLTTFNEKKRGMHICARCKKESKIKTDMRLIIAFIAVCLMVVMFMIVWNGSGNYNSIWGVVIVAAALVLFYFCTPLFIRYVPLKKYSKFLETDHEANRDFERFTFNKDIFNEVKKNRKPQSKPEEKTVIREVPIIKNVSESHASSDAPLKRVVTRPEFEEEEPEVEFHEDVRTYKPKKAGSKYTANRRF